MPNHCCTPARSPQCTLALLYQNIDNHWPATIAAFAVALLHRLLPLLLHCCCAQLHPATAQQQTIRGLQ